MRLRLGTRPSALALEQTRIATDALEKAASSCSLDLEVKVVRISTTGDQKPDAILSTLGDKGVFIAEIQKALADDRIDIAVHSAKDLAATEPKGLELAAFLERTDPRDVLVSRNGLSLADLEPGSVVGTSAARRQALVKAARPDLELALLRGNVDTRLRKVAEGEVDAAILAAAGLVRLGRTEVVTEWLDPEVYVPAPAQGAIALEARSDRLASDLGWISGADHSQTRACVTAEREFMRIVEGGCDVPLGAFARYAQGRISLVGFLEAVPEGAGGLGGAGGFGGPPREGRSEAVPEGAGGLGGAGSEASGAPPIRRAAASGTDPVAIGAELARRLTELG